MTVLFKESQVGQVIPDGASFTDAINVIKEGKIASVKVGVDISHSYVGDLKVSITAPNGSEVVLHDRDGGSQNDLNVIYEGGALEDLNGSDANGEWVLMVQDFAPRDEGTLNNWNVELTYADETPSEVYIPEGDDAWLVSSQNCKVAGKVIDAYVTVNVEHPYIGDLVVKIVAPSGKEVILHNREGGGTSNLDTTFDGDATAELVGEDVLGKWTLMAKDFAPRDTGILKYWKVGFNYQNLDDLSAVEGLSEEVIAVLNNNGVHSYSRLAALGTSKLTSLFSDTEIEVDYATANAWMDAAKALM